MLDSNGRLTDIGSWYLGGKATGNIPSSTSAAPRELASFGVVAAIAALAAFFAS